MWFTTGERLRVSLSGVSHGEAMRAVICGFPAGVTIDMAALRRFMLRRAPGRFSWQSARQESDEIIITSGINGGVTDGGAISLEIPNRDANSSHYAALQGIPRPGHADYPAYCRYGLDFDISGGSFFSARMTAPLCAAGGLCIQLLEQSGIYIGAHLASAGDILDTGYDPVSVTRDALFAAGGRDFPVNDEAAGVRMISAIERAAAQGDSLGGSVECAVLGLPAGFGSAVFGSIESRIAQNIFAIPAVKEIGFGNGAAACLLTGSENNDEYYIDGGAIRTRSNRHGGVLGGLATGMPLLFTVYYKPTPSIAKEQRTVDMNDNTETTISVGGRHDPCVAPRAVPCTEAAAALALADMLLCWEHGGQDIQALRAEIDAIDGELARLFGSRMQAARAIGLQKRQSGLGVRDTARERAVIERAAAQLPEADRAACAELFEALIRLSREAQEAQQ